MKVNQGERRMSLELFLFPSEVSGGKITSKRLLNHRPEIKKPIPFFAPFALYGQVGKSLISGFEKPNEGTRVCRRACDGGDNLRPGS